MTPNRKMDRRALPTPEMHVGGAASDAPPTTASEKLIAGIWKELLKRDGFSIHDSFFDLGGHSLLLIQLQSRLRCQFGHEIPMIELFQKPTIADMAGSVSQPAEGVERDPAAYGAGKNGALSPTVAPVGKEPTSTKPKREWRSLVAIQPNGSAPPLFLVPGGIGNPVTSAHFAMRLKEDRPVYGLQFVGLDGNGSPLKSVEQMAAHFLSEILSVQPLGPYHLAGHCLGGMIAFEKQYAESFQE